MTESLFGGEPLPIPLEAQIACIQRELRQRDHVYPRLVSEGKMTAEFAADQTVTMKAVLRTLQGLAEAAALDAELLRKERAARFTLAVGTLPEPQP